MSNNTEVDVTDYLDADGKVTYKPIDFNNFYLPPLTSVFSDLGYKPTLSNFVEYLNNDFDKPIGISKSSIRNISSKGISAKSGQKLLTWFKEALSTSIDFTILRKAATVTSLRIAFTRSTSSEWYPSIQTFEILLKRDNLGDLYRPLINFLKNRSAADASHIRRLRRDVKSKKIDINNLAMLWNRYKVILVEHSKVPKEQLDSFTNFIGDYRNTSEIEAKDEAQGMLPLMYLTYDFYLEFIAHYEVSMLISINSNDEAVPDLKSKKWLLTKAFENYLAPLDSENSELFTRNSHNEHSPKTLFGAMLKVLKDEMEKLKSSEDSGQNQDKHNGWRKLASFIEINTTDSLELLNQRQYDQIKQWRKGKDIPSFKNLNIFINNYLEYVDRSGNDLLEMCFRIMLMLDRLESRTLASVKDKPAAKDHIKTVLAQYSSYYHASLDQELTKQK
jgi:hypothetical protein